MDPRITAQVQEAIEKKNYAGLATMSDARKSGVPMLWPDNLRLEAATLLMENPEYLYLASNLVIYSFIQMEDTSPYFNQTTTLWSEIVGELDFRNRIQVAGYTANHCLESSKQLIELAVNTWVNLIDQVSLDNLPEYWGANPSSLAVLNQRLRYIERDIDFDVYDGFVAPNRLQTIGIEKWKETLSQLPEEGQVSHVKSLLEKSSRFNPYGMEPLKTLLENTLISLEAKPATRPNTNPTVGNNNPRLGS